MIYIVYVQAKYKMLLSGKCENTVVPLLVATLNRGLPA